MSGPADEARHRAANAVWELIEPVFRSLEGIAKRADAVFASGPRTTASSARLAETIRSALRRHPRLVDGIGVAFAPGFLTDAARWLEWWRSCPDGASAFMPHVFDETSIDHYDYERMPWFAAASASERGVATGPYIDSGGTNLHVITAGVPWRAGGACGVVGADLRPDSLERAFRQACPAQGRAMLLINARHRVIASTRTNWIVGDVLDARGAAQFEWLELRGLSADRTPWLVGSERATR